ncbi:hypothetical protein [Micromonospora sp. RTP1Z1]|uniref:hypothetical protein n=1 Tax=Micromonospora sp. RTP1Z1 TaxID=2994043 RepID=UPI0029C6B6C1|nr:hypothetical protein [Micromonospora sp. RTP1Z1]
MGARADDRLRGGLLAGLAVAALAAGGWWWRHAAPATGPVPSALSSAPATSAPPPAARRVLVDAEDGHIIIQGSKANLDEALVFHQESGAPDAGLVSQTVWEDRSHLERGDEPLIRQATPSMSDRYLLVVGCTGRGKLTVAFSGFGDDGPGQEVTCPGPSVTVPLTSSGGPLQVRFTVTYGDVDLDARLSALF